MPKRRHPDVVAALVLGRLGRVGGRATVGLRRRARRSEPRRAVADRRRGRDRRSDDRRGCGAVPRLGSRQRAGDSAARTSPVGAGTAADPRRGRRLRDDASRPTAPETVPIARLSASARRSSGIAGRETCGPWRPASRRPDPSRTVTRSSHRGRGKRTVTDRTQSRGGPMQSRPDRLSRRCRPRPPGPPAGRLRTPAPTAPGRRGRTATGRSTRTSRRR